MRPRLHPEMGIIPISARVALQLTALEWKHADATVKTPAQCARVVLLHLPLSCDGILRLALHSLGIYLDLGYTSHQWLKAVLEAAHFGHSFRRCFFFDYKENRSPYPRVTNRGVQNAPTAHQVRIKKGRVNA